MSLINMLSWWQWLIMAAVPPLIVMLYFLKLRRQPVSVPSTYLWKRTIEDLHVNSIWQRLRKNILLLLQLLTVLALILACLSPGYRGNETLGARSILLIDNSCSMQATDTGKTRLAEAREQAYTMIDALGNDDVAMVIAFNDRADVKQGFTSDKKRLRAAVAAITPTNRTTDLNEAMRAASGLANPGRTSQIEDLNDIQVAEAMPAKIYILSDGGFGVPQMDLGNLTAEYIPIGSQTANNSAIVAFTVERNLEKANRVEAYARLQNFGAVAVSAKVTLTLDGRLVDADQVDIEALSSTGVNFDLNEVAEGEFKLELELDDDLASDNVAFAGLDPARQLDVVLVTAGNTALEAALATEQASQLSQVRTLAPEALTTNDYLQLAAASTVDLFVFDQCAPEQMPLANTLFIGSVPPGDAWKMGESTGPLFVIDTNRSHPLMQYLDMGSVRIVEGNALTMPAGATELLRTNEGIMMAVAPREAYQDAVLGISLFHATENGIAPNTNWPIKPSFPVFVFNSLEYLGGAVGTAGSKTIKPGQNVVLGLANRYDKVQITAPTGKKTTVERHGGPQIIFTQTDQLGFYKTQPVDSDRLLQLFTVNLFSEQESNIVPTEEITIGAQNVAATGKQKEIVRIEIWRWLLAAALLILSVEWYLYNRRVAV